MGPLKSARAVQRLSDDDAETVIVVGVCGALDPALRPGDVFVADEVRGAGAARSCDGEEIATLLAGAGMNVARGVLLSTDHIVTGEEREVLRRSGARAVDMESAHLAPLADGRRFAVVRVVVDTPSRELSRALSTAAAGARALRTLGRIGRILDQLVHQ
jgi:4-hydroxy-3-methylbut-2-enyl diphosphate reductase